jgi:hypothetical protein
VRFRAPLQQSKDEYNTAKLQAQQNKYLSDVKVDGESYINKQYTMGATRISSYADFESMGTSRISSCIRYHDGKATTPSKDK